jgi:glycosyltransferase involved in cell wall biosynthesis
VLVNLSRNFGHQLAATAGIEIATGDAVILMDGDLQDPPELIEDFLQKWREGHDVVYAVRRTRKGESRFKLWTARAFYRIIKRLTKIAIPLDTGGPSKPCGGCPNAIAFFAAWSVGSASTK